MKKINNFDWFKNKMKSGQESWFYISLKSKKENCKKIKKCKPANQIRFYSLLISNKQTSQQMLTTVEVYNHMWLVLYG